MKITILCVVVMILLGVAHLQRIEFGINSEEGFRFRHGPKVEHSVPLTSIEQVSAPVDDEIGVDFENEPAGPDSLSYNDNKDESSTTSIKLTLGSDKNRLHAEYGTNFLFLGEVKNNLDRVTVVTSIPIPRFHDVKQVPLQFSNCTADLKRHGAREKGHPQRYAHEWCAKVMPFIQLMKAQEKDLVGSLQTLLIDDLYVELPELKPSDKFSKAKRSATQNKAKEISKGN